MNHSQDLAAIQRWMQSVITHPDGVAAGIESAEARREVNLPPGGVAEIITRSKSLSSLDRLAVYGNAYFVRLLECMRDEYPALVHALGDEAFDGLAFGYLQSYPSQSYTLADLGASFPKYLRETRPQTEGGDRPDWTDFVMELAELERLYSEIFDGPGPEDQRLLQVDDLLAIGAERWADAQLEIVPWLQLRHFHYPVHEFASAVRRRGENPSPPKPDPIYLAITRREYVVRRIPLSRPQHGLLSALLEGQAIGDALMMAAALEPEDSSQFAATDIRGWFEDWSAAGFFLSVTLSNSACELKQNASR